MSKLVICAALLVCAYALPPRLVLEQPVKIPRDDDKSRSSSVQVDQATVNNYTDLGLAYADKYMLEHDFDPLDLPDEQPKFNYTIIVDYTGTMNLTHGKLQDMATLHRENDVHVFSENPEGVFYANIRGVFHDWKATYDYEAAIAGIRVEGVMEAYIRNVEVQLVTKYDTVNKQLELLDFEVMHTGFIDITFSGHTIVDWLLNILGDAATAVLELRILHFLESVVGPSLATVFKELNGTISGS